MALSTIDERIPQLDIPAGLSSADKVLALLDAFDADHDVMGVSQLARRAGIAKSTAHRLLGVLVQWGMLSRDGNLYMLGSKLVELSTFAGNRLLRDVALPHLQDLYELTHGIVHLAVPDRGDALYVEKLYGHFCAKSTPAIGARVPLNRGPIGKVMLAHLNRDYGHPEALSRAMKNSVASSESLRTELERIESTGIAYAQERAPRGDTYVIAAPILDPSIGLIGAISITAGVDRVAPASIQLPLRTATVRIARALTLGAARQGRF
ncbi:IclR family transcriptional regulator [Microbacterium sp. X-17]|uniref:IclR family transcriptional regulator n=1 Tax=Microbacterium sp. X-17 TaxID=3144404 RepID=UPI0031F5A943